MTARNRVAFSNNNMGRLMRFILVLIFATVFLCLTKMGSGLQSFYNPNIMEASVSSDIFLRVSENQSKAPDSHKKHPEVFKPNRLEASGSSKVSRAFQNELKYPDAQMALSNTTAYDVSPSPSVLPMCLRTTPEAIEAGLRKSVHVFDMMDAMSWNTSHPKVQKSIAAGFNFHQFKAFAQQIYTSPPVKNLSFVFVHDSTMNKGLCAAQRECSLCQHVFSKKVLEASPTREFVGRVPCGIISQSGHPCTGTLHSSGFELMHKLVSGDANSDCFMGCPVRNKITGKGGLVSFRCPIAYVGGVYPSGFAHAIERWPRILRLLNATGNDTLIAVTNKYDVRFWDVMKSLDLPEVAGRNIVTLDGDKAYHAPFVYFPGEAVVDPKDFQKKSSVLSETICPNRYWWPRNTRTYIQANKTMLRVGGVASLAQSNSIIQMGRRFFYYFQRHALLWQAKSVSNDTKGNTTQPLLPLWIRDLYLGKNSHKLVVLCISRKDATSRNIKNFDAMHQRLVNAFPDVLFPIYLAKNLTLLQQIALVSRADILVGPSGAGLMLNMFMRPGPAFAVLDIMYSPSNVCDYHALYAFAGNRTYSLTLQPGSYSGNIYVNVTEIVFQVDKTIRTIKLHRQL